MTKIALFWRTTRHLKTRQILYQAWNRVRRQPALRLPNRILIAHFLTVSEADKPISWQKGAFSFLNQLVDFRGQIDWNYAEKSKLWTYNLNYFDFLNQPNILPDEGLKLIRNFIAQTNLLREGLEPYPTSLRIINWIQFLSRHKVRDDQLNAHLFAQTQLLNRRLEYHLAGNHLLENGFALLMSALYFRQANWFRKAAKLVRTELVVQILADGCHDERSPVYHQILLDRLLTILLALQHDTWQPRPDLVHLLGQKSDLMLRWLNAITFRNGDVPMVNDAAFGIASTTAKLLTKAKRIASLSLSGNEQGVHSQISGYRMFRQNRYELFVDVGAVGPNHQPGHAHADTFSFVLYVDNLPILVDSGTSTYQLGERRAWERSTAAHNTVEVAKTNSSEVWAGFRVGRRARVMVMKNTETSLTAQHDGYRRLDTIHQRSWSIETAKLTIVDRLLDTDNQGLSEQRGIARFHFHPGIAVQVVGDVAIAGSIQLLFSSVIKLNIFVTTYEMAEGFNQLRQGKCLEIAFTGILETTITLLNEHTLSNLLF